MHCQNNDFRPPTVLVDFPGRVNSVQQRHGGIGDDRVGLQSGGGVQQGPAIRDGAHYLEFKMSQHPAQIFDHDRVNRRPARS